MIEIDWEIIILLLSSFTLSFIITLLLIPRIKLFSVRKRILDKPNHRKIHSTRASRLGGVSFFPSIFISVTVVVSIFALFKFDMWGMVATQWLFLSICACFIPYGIGIADDIDGLRHRLKFIFQTLAAVLITLSGTWLDSLYGFCGIYTLPVWLGVPFTILLIVFIINSINLIDGIDGLASGLSIIALVVFGIVFYMKRDFPPALLSVATTGALLAFLRYNLRNTSVMCTKIFMGDAGTLFTGTMLALLTARLLQKTPHNDGSLDGQTLILISFSVLFIPCMDVLRVMLYRLRNNRPLFHPDKNHIHHKLLAIGFTPRQVLIIILGYSICLGVVNIYLNTLISIELVFSADILFWIGLQMLVSRKANNATCQNL